VPLIIESWVDWYRSVGTVKSPGTKCFSLSGSEEHRPGRVPSHVLQQLIEVIGGGAEIGSNHQAAQNRRPSGGCIPADRLDTPVDYENLRTLAP